MSASFDLSEVKASFARSTKPDTNAKLFTAFKPSDSSVVTSIYLTRYFSSMAIVRLPWYILEKFVLTFSSKRALTELSLLLYASATQSNVACA